GDGGGGINVTHDRGPDAPVVRLDVIAAAHAGRAQQMRHAQQRHLFRELAEAKPCRVSSGLLHEPSTSETHELEHFARRLVELRDARPQRVLELQGSLLRDADRARVTDELVDEQRMAVGLLRDLVWLERGPGARTREQGRRELARLGGWQAVDLE